jgi:hypothetical protein
MLSYGNGFLQSGKRDKMPQIKRIMTSGEKKIMQKKQERRARWVGVIIALIMVFSVAAFAFMENNPGEENKQKYKDFTFEMSEIGWQTTVNGQLITTSFLPQDVENISSSNFIPTGFGNAVYFIANTYDERNAAEEISKAIQAQRMQLACLPEDADAEYCSELPLKNCTDASSDTGIIIIKEENESSVDYGNFCMKISGNSSEILKASDKAIFVMFNII